LVAVPADWNMPGTRESLNETDWTNPLYKTDFLFNTVPSRVVVSGVLRRLPPHAIVAELASAPYGFDAEAARAMGLRTCALPALPRHFPHTAAKLTADVIEGILDELRGGHRTLQQQTGGIA